MSSQPQSPPPVPDARRGAPGRPATGQVAARTPEQRREHYRAGDDQPVLVELPGTASAEAGAPAEA
jgi:hypothetical protein